MALVPAGAPVVWVDVWIRDLAEESAAANAVIRDVLASLDAHGFRRVLLVNGHGGNGVLHRVAAEWNAARPTSRVRVHDWWKAPRTWAKAQAIDPVASHASWMENFPWTRLPGVAMPTERKPMIDLARYQRSDPGAKKALIGDGNFGGHYQRPDADLTAVWDAAVLETRALITSDWE